MVWVILLERLNSVMLRGIWLDGSLVRISCIDSGISIVFEVFWIIWIRISVDRFGVSV